MMWRVTALFTVLLSFTAATVSRAATPREQVLRLVPEDVGFCLLVQDLRSHAKAFFDSPFLSHLCASPLGKRILEAPEARTLSQVKTIAEKQLGMSLAQLRDEILGDAVVLAYRPGPVDDPAKEQGLLALHARDPVLLERLLKRINEIQTRSGELTAVEPRAYRGLKYQHRKLVQGSNCWAIQGALLVFATDEGLLREALDRCLEPAGAEDASVARHFRLLRLENRLAALWINPRTFEPALRRRASEVSGLRAVALKTLLTYWEALEGLALTVAVQKDFELALTVRAQEERLPPAARRFLATAAQPSELWQCFPEDAIFAMAGRFDVLAFAELSADFLPEPARAVVRVVLNQWLGAFLHREMLGRILPQIGPDWGFCVLPPQRAEKACIPPLLVALRVRQGAADSSTERELRAAVESYAELLVKTFNQLHAATMRLQSVFQDKVEVKYLEEDSVFAPGFRPAFAFKGGYLLLASSPDAIRRFPAQPLPPTRRPSAEVPFARFSPQALATFLKAGRPSLCTYLALVHQLPREEIEQRLDNLLQVLELLEGVEVVKRSAPGQMSLVLRIRTVQPLR